MVKSKLFIDDKNKYYNGFSEDEIFKCKDNHYLQDCSDVFHDFENEYI